MGRDINYIPEVMSIKCSSCNEDFSLYKIQILPVNFCGICAPENRSATLFSINQIAIAVIKMAESNKEFIDDRQVIEVETILSNLQNKNYPL